MKHIFSKYKLQLIKETSAKYECENKITSPNVVKNICCDVFKLDKECEEVMLMIALDTKNKVIGTFELSRGTLNATVAHPREIFKRLLLCNANGFILAHNHPSGDIMPSQEDINTCKNIKDCSIMMDIKLIDFCIVGDELYSFKQHGIL